MGRVPGVPVKVLPGWAAIGLTVVGGVGSAAQSLANAEMGERTGHPIIGALVNNTGGMALVLLGLLALPSMRTGLGVVFRTRLPWWTYLGGLCGAFFIVAATYIVPVLGVAVYTIAQVAGSSAGGLVVDRTRLAPAGRMGLTGPRMAGAALGVGAVALAQFGRPVGDLAVGLVLLGVACGVVIAVQGALNGRVSAVGNPAAATAVNFAVSSVGMVAVAAVVGVLARLGSTDWPAQWYLYIGGPLGVAITVAVLLGIRSVGLLRTGLALVAGQLGGALLLDLRPGGPGASVAVLVGAVMTLLAVIVSGRATRIAPAAP
ncbi:DMT family transporter [Plantactinospora soyae]|uniref:Transporter family-2 protein n=1 Tax=Plantactinospora soyae TaxID=1544732 RepID=A0A927R0V3_9ACTN|nr:DMT family transporter [Plantactinospora soyae]MBE1489043.1 transporter family-2 protein [Plantactinospora soyae]